MSGFSPAYLGKFTVIHFFREAATDIQYLQWQTFRISLTQQAITGLDGFDMAAGIRHLGADMER
jgi:hypothetical protein